MFGPADELATCDYRALRLNAPLCVYGLAAGAQSPYVTPIRYPLSLAHEKRP